MKKQIDLFGRIFLVLSVLLLSAVVKADSVVITEIRVDGAVDPAGIPEWYKASELFRSYRGELF